MTLRVFLLLCLAALLQANPIPSPTFDEILHRLIAEAPYRFDDDRIDIEVPICADNPSQVPVRVDATQIADAVRLILFVDLNLVPKVVDMKLIEARAAIALNIRVAQETPIRALVQDAQGRWHIGSANIRSAGGGCAPSELTQQNPDVWNLMGRHRARVSDDKGVCTIRCSIFHPMQTGYAFGTSEFFIETLTLYGGDKPLMEMALTTTVSENPRMTLQTRSGTGHYRIELEDNDANAFTIDAR